MAPPKKTTPRPKKASAPVASGKVPRKGGSWKVIGTEGAPPPAKAKPAPKAAKKPAPKKATPPKDKTKPAPKERGRPSIYTPELARSICLRIAAGESVRSISRDENMPAESTIRSWAVDDIEGFNAQYTRAIQIRAVGWAEEIIEISDDGSQDTYIDPATGQERTNHEIVARSRLRTDNRKWMLSKVLPKVYGDKLDVNHGVQPENPLSSLLQRIAGSGLPVIKDEPT